MSAPLLHLITTSEWRAALGTRAVAPPSLTDVGFVHLSTAEQVTRPADRLFPGRRDLLLLVLDPARLGVEVRFEPGLPTDPADMRFPHAYGPVPTSAVLAVLPYRPGPGPCGGFAAPVVPDTDPAGRHLALDRSVLRRTATDETPVTGGVAVRTAPVPLSRQHNKLLVWGDTDAATVAADADRAQDGLDHRTVALYGARSADVAAGLAALGWRLDELVGMAAPAGGPATGRVERVGGREVRPLWDANWRREIPGVGPDVLAQLADRFELEAAVIDLRHLAVRAGGRVVASAVLKIDGATATLDAVGTDPAFRGRGYGNLLVSEALAVAGAAGCDLVTLDADAADWPWRWYARHGFAEVTRGWQARRADILPEYCNSR